MERLCRSKGDGKVPCGSTSTARRCSRTARIPRSPRARSAARRDARWGEWNGCAGPKGTGRSPVDQQARLAAAHVQRGFQGRRGLDQPRDATRGGVNGPAVPVQRGREGPLWINKHGSRLITYSEDSKVAAG